MNSRLASTLRFRSGLALVAILALFCGFSETASAVAKGSRRSGGKATTTLQNLPAVVTVPVPRSEIITRQEPPPPEKPTFYEFAASSYFPSNFVRPTYSGTSTAFAATSTPAVDVRRVGAFATLSNGLEFSSVLGAMYLPMQRTMRAALGPVTAAPVTEDAHLFMLRAGAAVRWIDVLPWRLSPTASVSLLPAWMGAERSALEDSTNESGFATELTLGLAWDFAPATDGPGWGVGVTAQSVSGAAGGSKLDGTGVEAALRLSL